MERIISIRRMVFRRTVLIQRVVVERMISMRRMVFRKTVLIQRVVVERMVQKVVSYIALLP